MCLDFKNVRAINGRHSVYISIRYFTLESLNDIFHKVKIFAEMKHEFIEIVFRLWNLVAAVILIYLFLTIRESFF